MTALREFARRLAPSGPVRHLATGGPARRRATDGRPLRLHPYARRRAGLSTASTKDNEKFEKYYKVVRATSAIIGLVSTAAGSLGAVGYWVISSVSKEMDAKLQADRESTAIKMEGERVRTEEFRTLATKTHLDTVRRIDENLSDMRLQFNKLSVTVLEGKHLEAYYRSQILKAQEVLDREGPTTSSELHAQVLPKMIDLESKVESLTEEVTKLRIMVKENDGDVASEKYHSFGVTKEGSKSQENDGDVASEKYHSFGVTKEGSKSQEVTSAVAIKGVDQLSQEPFHKVVSSVGNSVGAKPTESTQKEVCGVGKSAGVKQTESTEKIPTANGGVGPETP